VDVDSTSPEVHNSVYRKKKKMKVFSNFGRARYSQVPGLGHQPDMVAFSPRN
jgi:hypothetical protein